MRVLIWHGNHAAAEGWEAAFARRGHRVDRVKRAHDAVEALREIPYDLFIFDLVVDRESGLAVALLAEFHQPELHSILISDRQPETQSEVFARLGALSCVLSVAAPARDVLAVAESVVMRARCEVEIKPDEDVCPTCPIQPACARAVRMDTSVAPERVRAERTARAARRHSAANAS